MLLSELVENPDNPSAATDEEIKRLKGKLERVHFCMTSRGVKKQDSSMVTSAIRGVFKESAEARAEFLKLISL